MSIGKFVRFVKADANFFRPISAGSAELVWLWSTWLILGEKPEVTRELIPAQMAVDMSSMMEIDADGRYLAWWRMVQWLAGPPVPPVGHMSW